jgi:hypothetical protein
MRMNLLQYERKAIWAKVKAHNETIWQGVKEYYMYWQALHERHWPEFRRLLVLTFWVYVAML